MLLNTEIIAVQRDERNDDVSVLTRTPKQKLVSLFSVTRHRIDLRNLNA